MSLQQLIEQHQQLCIRQQERVEAFLIINSMAGLSPHSAHLYLQQVQIRQQKNGECLLDLQRSSLETVELKERTHVFQCKIRELRNLLLGKEQELLQAILDGRRMRGGVFRQQNLMEFNQCKIMEQLMIQQIHRYKTLQQEIREMEKVLHINSTKTNPIGTSKISRVNSKLLEQLLRQSRRQEILKDKFKNLKQQMESEYRLNCKLIHRYMQINSIERPESSKTICSTSSDEDSV